MTPDYPHHSDDAFMHNTTPVQSFVDAAHEVTEEERNRPRYGRPDRRAGPTPADAPHNTTPVQSFVAQLIPVKPGDEIGPRYGRPGNRPNLGDAPPPAAPQ